MESIQQTNLIEARQLQVVCSSCKGNGRLVAPSGRLLKCGYCDGSGFKLTDFGEEVLEIVRRNLRSMLEDEMSE